MTAWNLLEDFATAPQGLFFRFFDVPLAGAISDRGVPFELAKDLPSPSAYSFNESHDDDTSGNDYTKFRTKDVTFTISIAAGTYPTDPGFPNLPPGAFRLHSMAAGKLTFQPAASGGLPQLTLEMRQFSTISIDDVPWWGRWIDAKSIPEILIYENVDVTELEKVLRSAPASGLGIEFPKNADGTEIADKSGFVDQFLQGATDHYFDVTAGAVLGAAAAAPAGPAGNRELRLHARYVGHKVGSERPMNPRELFYLLFGEKSTFSRQHPLMQQLTATVAGPIPKTTDLVMRPPLRTSQRLMWEAGREAALDDALRNATPPQPPSWGSTRTGANGFSCSLAPDSLFDTKLKRGTATRTSGPVSYGRLPGSVKCNVFVGDICVRAGFRVPIQDISAATDTKAHWHYIHANGFANGAREALASDATGQGITMRGRASGDQKMDVWALARTRILSAVDVDKNDAASIARKNAAIAAVGKLVDPEGRALVMSAARPRTRAAQTVAACNAASFKDQSGHVVLVQSIVDFSRTANPDIAGGTSPGLTATEHAIDKVQFVCAQAASTTNADPGGAQVNFTRDFHLGGQGGAGGAPGGFIRIHLLEAQPGGDPDLVQGLLDLHLVTTDRPFLRNALDRARQKVPISGQQSCCQDNWPNPPAPGPC